jgi:glycosyltransferase involved in cell wall biosynthesis
MHQRPAVMSLIVGIDASRNRSGGAKAYLIGILSSLDPARYGISEIHLWTFQSLLDSIPDRSWLVKHNPQALEQNLAKQLWWQAVHLAKDAEKVHCNILFTTDASTLCRFKPMVVFNQDLLSYEPEIMRQFGYGYQRLRLLAILFIQNRAFHHSEGVIFLTRYTGNLIQKSCGILKRVIYIPHGVDESFKDIQLTQPWPKNHERPIHCLYVSPISEYKHQQVVVRAIARLRKRGYDLTLTLIGAGSGRAQEVLDSEIVCVDPGNIFVTQLGSVSYDQMPFHLSDADIFVFASSCETFGITLLEGMAAGLPIACSNRSSLPEILEDGGVYFDPEDAVSIGHAIERIITDNELRICIARKAKVLSSYYSWQRCADETFAFIAETYNLRDNKQS